MQAPSRRERENNRWLTLALRAHRGPEVRTRLSICARKVRYGTEQDAVAAAEGFGLPLLPYRCDRCGRFHLTSRTKGKRIPRPDRSDT